MTFHWPQLLWLLLIPLLIAVLDLRRRRRAQSLRHPKILRAEAGVRDLVLDDGPKPAAGGEGPRFRWRLALGSVLLVFALARPQWGQLDEPVFDQAREIVIALDLSRSMLATDVRPSRLERAKLLVTSLLERLAGERVGLVVFSGTAFLQSPLSSDYEILNEFLPSLTPDYLPEGGTQYRSLIDTALGAFGSSGAADRFLIVLSDGEATDDDWKDGADELAKRGIRVLGLGLGTTQGSIIPDGSGGYVKDERGAVVLSKLESGTLQELASKTQGVYTDASSWVDLAQLLQSTVEASRKGQFREERHVRLVERFQWALAPALLLLLASFWREFPVRPRPRNVRLRTSGAADTARAAGAASLLALLAAPLLFAPAPSRAAETSVAEPLSKLVAQFSSRDALTARDYAELARTTATWGQRLQSSQQPIVEGAVRDGLAAVAAGRALDPQAADWKELDSELNKLLEKHEAPPPPEQQQDPNQSQDSQQKNQQKQNQNQNQDQEKKQDPQKQPSSQPQPPDEKPSSPKPESSPGEKPPEAKPEGRNPPSAFGEMTPEKAEPKAPQNSATPEIQKVGGDKEKEAPPSDPRLVVPLQKLQQVRNQDSPVRLQQLLRGEKEAPAKTGKNW